MAISVLTEPSAREALELIEQALAAEEVLTIIGRCDVVYDGRAASYLGPGERLVILKPDGTLLVHRAEQRTPVNWQPPGCTHEASLDDADQLLVRSTRTTPAEEIELRFEAFALVAACALIDEEPLVLEGSEEDLRQRILDEPDLLEDGFTPLATERETAAGAIDIYGEDAVGAPTVVELKRRRVGPDAVSQLKRYVDALDRETATATTPRGILVAPSITGRAERLLAAEELDYAALTASAGGNRTRTTLTEFLEDNE